jgi:hypothetical protein
MFDEYPIVGLLFSLAIIVIGFWIIFRLIGG